MSVADPQLRIAELERQLHWAQLKIQVLEQRLRQQRISVLGPHSETLSNLQLASYVLKAEQKESNNFKPPPVAEGCSEWKCQLYEKLFRVCSSGLTRHLVDGEKGCWQEGRRVVYGRART